MLLIPNVEISHWIAVKGKIQIVTDCSEAQLLRMSSRLHCVEVSDLLGNLQVMTNLMRSHHKILTKLMKIIVVSKTSAYQNLIFTLSVTH